jgi:hypothetical protein
VENCTTPKATASPSSRCTTPKRMPQRENDAKSLPPSDQGSWVSPGGRRRWELHLADAFKKGRTHKMSSSPAPKSGVFIRISSTRLPTRNTSTGHLQARQADWLQTSNHTRTSRKRLTHTTLTVTHRPNHGPPLSSRGAPIAIVP